MENDAPHSPVTVIDPQPAPNDSFIGPEFMGVHKAIKRRDKKCHCTACGEMKDSTLERLYAHPILNVLMCESCDRFYHYDDFTKDEDGYDEQCRWCGQGGNLLMCDSADCRYSFCNYCIKRNFSEYGLEKILASDKWLCFVCKKSQLKALIEQCKKFVNISSASSHNRKVEDDGLSVSERLTKTNKLIDNILEPLERSCNGLAGTDIAREHKSSTHVQNFLKKRISPLTIFRNSEKSYAVQQKSASCDESVTKSFDRSSQSDPELPSQNEFFKKRQHLENKSEIASNQSIIENGARTITDSQDFSKGCNGIESTHKTAIVNDVSDVENVPPTVSKNYESIANLQDGSYKEVNPPVRKNTGRRTPANRACEMVDVPEPCVDQNSFDDSNISESSGHRKTRLDQMLLHTEKLFETYLNYINELVEEVCPTSDRAKQSPSQYSRFRAIKAILSRVKIASKQLSWKEQNLQITKAKLERYRDPNLTPTLSGEESDSLRSAKNTRSSRNLAQTFAKSEEGPCSDVNTMVYDLGNVTSIFDDAKLKMEPVVLLEKLRYEDIQKWSQPRNDSDFNIDSDVDSSLESLDTDSSKHGKDMFGSSDSLKSVEGELQIPGHKTSSNETQGGGKKRCKNVANGDTSFSSDSDNDESSDLDSSFNSTTEDEAKHITIHESENAIAKTLLLQRIMNNHVDDQEQDEDVDNLLGKSMNDKVPKEKENSTTNNTGLKKIHPDKNSKSLKHLLLSKSWKSSLQESGDSSNGEPKKRKLLPDKETDEVQKKNKHIMSQKLESCSDSDLSTDSDDNIVRRPGLKRNMKMMLDSDPDSSDDFKVGDILRNSPDSDDDEQDFKSCAKRRRIIKQEPPEAGEMNESLRKGRKNIRKVLDDDEVSRSTQEAKVEEMERRKRIEDKDKIEEDESDIIVIEDDKQEEFTKTVTTRLIFSKKPLIEVHPMIVKDLKPHQREGIHFIWDNLIERIEFANSKAGTGCILSHCMGLGKTLQTIAFLHAILLSEHLPKLKTALVLCPFITVNNWKAEFQKWLPKENLDRSLSYFDLNSVKNDKERLIQLQHWRGNGGVLIMGYSLFRTLLSRNVETRLGFEATLLTADILVCDEGHLLKNASTAIASCVGRSKTKRRLILTGTPIQNNMIEYHCMVSLVKPRLLGDLKEFKNRFVNPIENGQHVDSTDRDVRLMKKRAHVLHELLAGCVQRKDYTYLKEHLLPKYEYTLKVRLSKLQIRLYEKYLSLKSTGDWKTRKTSLFRDFNKLLLVVCHPRCLVMQKEMQVKVTVPDDDDGDEDEGCDSDDSVILVCDEDAPTPVIPNPTSLEDIHALSRKRLCLFIENKSGKTPTLKSRKNLVSMAEKYLDENFCKTVEFEESLNEKSVAELKSLIAQHGGSLAGCREKVELVNLVKSLVRKESATDEEWFERVMPSQENLYFANEHGGKIVLMLEILRGAAKLGDKVVIFSQSLLTLNLIEIVLRAESKTTTSVFEGTFSKWVKNKDYFRIDGSIPGNRRTLIINSFNKPSNQRGRVLLVSTRAGSMGINLVSANRAIVFDASWNPSNDMQSIFRIYRFGQKKTCYIYRLVAQGTMEEKIYERQVVKRSLSYRVVDEQQIPRHFTAADISELYTFKPDQKKLKKDAVPDCAPPRDVLLASIINSTDLIVSFHEPDTLLDHQVSEELSEAERKAAWEEFDKDNPMAKSVPLQLMNRMENMPRHDLDLLCNQVDDALKSIVKEISEIPLWSLDERVIRLRIKNRAISTEKVTVEAIQQRLDDHMKLRKLYHLKKVGTWYRENMAKVYLSRFGIPGPLPQLTSFNSFPGTSGSAMSGNSSDPRWPGFAWPKPPHRPRFPNTFQQRPGSIPRRFVVPDPRQRAPPPHYRPRYQPRFTGETPHRFEGYKKSS